jgi:hypothetical protein
MGRVHLRCSACLVLLSTKRYELNDYEEGDEMTCQNCYKTLVFTFQATKGVRYFPLLLAALLLAALLFGCSGESFGTSGFAALETDGGFTTDAGAGAGGTPGAGGAALDVDAGAGPGGTGAGGKVGHPAAGGAPGAGGTPEMGGATGAGGNHEGAGGETTSAGGTAAFPPVQCSDPGPCANVCHGPSGLLSPCCYYLQPGGPSTWQSCGCPSFDQYGNQRACAP